MKDIILVVDDVQLNRIILEEILCDDYDIVQASNGVEAIDILFNMNVKPAGVLLDIMMPEMDGFEVIALMKGNSLTADIPVLFITAADADTNESKCLLEGAVDFITKPLNPDVVKARVDSHVQLYKYKHDLELLVEAKAAELMVTHEKILETLATIIEYRSLESGDHVRRSSELTKALINHLLTKPQFKQALINQNYASISKAAALHDIGKVGIPDSILLKPGKLTSEEFDIIKTHSLIGSQIIESLDLNNDEMYLKHCRDICRHHHEKWDGNGYPDKISGEAIPLSARIVTIVDVYDALVSKRCYKEGMSHEQAMNILTENAGTQFDPNIVEAFVEINHIFYELKEKMKD